MNKHHEEKRKHKRFPIIKDIAEPLDILILGGEKPSSITGILTNLSAGGVDLVLMGTVQNKESVQLTLNHIPNLDGLKVSGRVVWTKEKGGTTAIGIQFTQIDPRQQDRINTMANAYWACEDRINAGEFEVCFRECSYWNLCTKQVKLTPV